MFENLIYLLLGLAGLWFGGEVAIPAAQRLALKLKISEAVIGLTIVSIGTSLPEIATNVTTGFRTFSDPAASGIAIGDVIGSCLGQITLILGICGFIATLYISNESLKRDGLMMLAALIIAFIAASDLYISPLEGIVMVLIYLSYLVFLSFREQVFVKREDGITIFFVLKEIFLILIGLVIIIFASNFVVDNGVSLARILGVKEVLIGLFIGLGSAFPELSVSVKAILKKSGELSLGNLIGSNITDPLFSLGLGASINGFKVLPQTLTFYFPFWLASATIALLLLYNHTNLNRKESGVLILLFILFMYLTLVVL